MSEKKSGKEPRENSKGHLHEDLSPGDISSAEKRSSESIKHLTQAAKTAGKARTDEDTSGSQTEWENALNHQEPNFKTCEQNHWSLTRRHSIHMNECEGKSNFTREMKSGFSSKLNSKTQNPDFPSAATKYSFCWSQSSAEETLSVIGDSLCSQPWTDSACNFEGQSATLAQSAESLQPLCKTQANPFGSASEFRDIGIVSNSCPSHEEMEQEKQKYSTKNYNTEQSLPDSNNEVLGHTHDVETSDDDDSSLQFSRQRQVNSSRNVIESEEEDMQMLIGGKESDLFSSTNLECDENSEKGMVVVGQYKNKGKNMRKYDKQVACVFCDKLLRGKLMRHLEKMHSNETEVAKVLALSSKEERRRGIADLANRGNFKHNSAVLSTKHGSLIVRRRPSKNSYASDDYLPCQHCLGMYLKHDLWRHAGKCAFKRSADDSDSCENHKKRTSVTAASRMILEGAIDSGVPVSHEFKTEIIDRMRYDSLTRRARNDILIMKFGSALHHKHGQQRVHDISQQMRQLARLLKEIQLEEENDYVTLERCLCGRHFDAVLEATERLCQRETENNSGRPLFKNPTLGLKIGHILVKCAEIKKGMAIRSGDKIMEGEADAFLALHRSDWTDRISSTSLASIKHRRYNNPDILPITSDLLKLKNYQEQSVTVFAEALRKTATYSVWRQLSHIVYSRLVIFNKRRGGETAKLLLTAFLNRPKWQGVANDILVKSLKPLEQKLLKRMDMVHLPGKGIGGRRVPLILSPNVVSAMELLVAKRECCGIPTSNTYFFATLSANGYINGWQVMHTVAKAAKLKHPELIHSTRLRKYVATVTQVVSLTSGELKWLANHLGHDVTIFENVYRQQDSTIELAKIARLMMAVDTGEISRFSGKSLDEIQISDIPLTMDESEDDGDDDAVEDGTAADIVHNQDVNNTPRSIPHAQGKSDASFEQPSDLSDDDTMSSLPADKTPMPKLKHRKTGMRVKWKPEEISILKKELVKFFQSVKVPMTAEINRIIEKYPTFQKRTVAQIKSRAWDLIKNPK